MFKVCSVCKIKKSLDSFHSNNQTFDRKSYKCKPCQKIISHNYYLKHKEKVNCRTLAYQRQNPDKRKNYKLKQRYRISKNEYDKLFEIQNGVCFICKEFRLTANKTRLSVDHCHKTGKVRGLLCDNCNKALGLFKDSKEYLDNALKYLSI